MEITTEKSTEAAYPIQMILFFAGALDINYLSECLKQMRNDISRRESIAVLNPNPLTHNASQKLYQAKTEQLATIIKLGENMNKIAELHGKLQAAELTQEELAQMFQV